VFETQAVSDAAGLAKADVLLETKIDALDITILRGGGDEVGAWAIEHGFLLTPDAPEMLDHYSHQSKVFMAARFDATRASDLGQNRGDGTPIMLTIPVDEPWVPLRILSLGRSPQDLIQADVFLLTDKPSCCRRARRLGAPRLALDDPRPTGHALSRRDVAHAPAGPGRDSPRRPRRHDRRVWSPTRHGGIA
jgi:hypothetical protein